MTSKTPLMHAIAPASRLHYMDNCRALLCLAVLMIHSGMAYTTPDYFPWLSQDPAGNHWMNIVVFLLHTFAMPCFFVVGGFFTRRLWCNEPILFWKNRLLRIALPFVTLLLLYTPFKFTLFINELFTQYVKIHHHSPPVMTIVKQSQALSPLLSHLTAPNELWFLWYLLFFYLLIYPLSFLEKHFSPGRLSFLLFTVVIPISITHWKPHTHIIEPHSLILAPSYFIYFACYFIVGWFAEKTPILFHHFTRYMYPCCFFLTLGIASLYVLATPFHYEPSGLEKLLAFQVLHELVTVSAVCLFFAVLYCYGDKPNPLLRYLADCSYWCYLTRLCFIITLQSLLAPLPWPIAIKFIIVVCTTQILCCTTYELLVRHTALNRFVGNGKNTKTHYTHTQKNPLSFQSV